MTQASKPVVFVIPGDLHLTEPELDNHRVARWVVDQVNELIRPDFVQFIGDNVQHGQPAEFGLFREVCCEMQVPYYALVGDHDVHQDPAAENFQRYVGPTYGMHRAGDFRFLRLNTQQAQPVGMLAEQLDWFAEQLVSAKAAGEQVVLLQHNYPFQIWESFAGPGIDRWRELVFAHRVAAVFSGHTHYLQVANDGRNVFVATRSIGDPEGGPPGYLLGYAGQDDLAVTFRSVAEQGPVVLITHPRDQLLATGPEHIVSGQDQWRVRVWSQRPLASVCVNVNGTGWCEMASQGDNLWARDLAAAELPKGENRCEARAIDTAGLEGRTAIIVQADATGRYTAVPMARPVVKDTAFC